MVDHCKPGNKKLWKRDQIHLNYITREYLDIKWKYNVASMLFMKRVSLKMLFYDGWIGGGKKSGCPCAVCVCGLGISCF